MRTQEQINSMIKALKAEADRLPPTNIFGDSNADDIAELRSWAAKLETGHPYHDDNVIRWMSGNSSDLDDAVETIFPN